jgi:DNA-binding LytR/AlgR family response regulator
VILLSGDLRVAICEDESEDIKRLYSFVENSDIPVKADCFKSGEAFLHTFAAGKYDLIFIDIYMSGISGVNVAEHIREADKNVTLAFTTSSLEHTLESYRLGAIKYLEKPLKEHDVLEALELSVMKKKSRACVTLLIGGKYKDILLDEIIYFEHRNHAVIVHTISGELRTSQSVKLDAVDAKVPSPPFLRCHYSFIVNLNYVQSRDKEYPDFIMTGGVRVPITRGLQKRCRETFNLHRMELAGKDED